MRVLGVDALDAAIAELRHEARYYERRGGAAVRDAFLDDLAGALARVIEAPRSFPSWPRRPGVRRALLARFPFAIGFVMGGEASAEPPLVVVFAHLRRRPGYWSGRAPSATRGRRSRRRAGG